METFTKLFVSLLVFGSSLCHVGKVGRCSLPAIR